MSILISPRRDVDRYSIVGKAGNGKYSELFCGLDGQNDKVCIIKTLKPVGRKKVKREIHILRALCGGPNIIKLQDVCRDAQTETVSTIFEHVDNNDYRELLPTFRLADVRFYIYEILKALNYAHSRGIMHRDVKPQSIVIDRHRKKLRLID